MKNPTLITGTLLVLALLTPALTQAQRPNQDVPLDAPTRVQVHMQGWSPYSCQPPNPLDAAQPLGVIITGTGTVYTREVLAMCEDLDPGEGVEAVGVFTATLAGFTPGEAITYWIKGRLSHMSRVGTGLAGQEITTAPLKAGDFDNDNSVGANDFSILQSVYGMTEEDANAVGRWENWYRANINRNESPVQPDVVDIVDFSLMKGNFGAAGE